MSRILELVSKSCNLINEIGAFGVVKLGKWRGTQVAIKTAKNLLTEKQLLDFKMEISAMAKLRPHKSKFFLRIQILDIVTFLGVCTDPKHPLCIVTEFMKSGSLWQRLQKSDPITDKVKLDWIRGIACGMVCIFQFFCKFSSCIFTVKESFIETWHAEMSWYQKILLFTNSISSEMMNLCPKSRTFKSNKVF